ncbi:MAG: small multi-drug export protein [Neisseriaceae bacterium]|nr:small multi-drug export protein [Neisseriaceae bacterium]
MKNYLYVFLIAMLPLIELRGAIPVAYAFNATDANFSLLLAYFLIIISNIFPIPIIYFFAHKILLWGKNKLFIGKICTAFIEKGEKAGRKLQEKAGKGLFWALVLFVGIPLPGTGAWTGTLAASLLNIDFKRTLLAVSLGVVLAGLIIGLLCTLGFGAWFGVKQ